ncbi:hypothetical protein D2909_04150 [Planococcus salinarum]|nr:hypothetical protein D2909_04150 [Planococcus salinarum]
MMFTCSISESRIRISFCELCVNCVGDCSLPPYNGHERCYNCATTRLVGRGITMGSKKESGKQTSYAQKLAAVQEVLEKKRHIQEVAEELSIHPNSLTNWLRKYREKGPEGLQPYRHQSSTYTSQTAELERLKAIEKKYNDQIEEIEILKKFQAFLKENE